MKYLKQFLIGSSYFVFLPFFYAVQNNQPTKQYSYYQYSLIAPLWFGIWNILSLIIAEHLGISQKFRFLLISVISSISVMLISFNFKMYLFTNEQWKKYFILIFIKYLIIWNIIISYLENIF